MFGYGAERTADALDLQRREYARAVGETAVVLVADQLRWIFHAPHHGEERALHRLVREPAPKRALLRKPPRTATRAATARSSCVQAVA